MKEMVITTKETACAYLSWRGWLSVSLVLQHGLAVPVSMNVTFHEQYLYTACCVA